jgi:phage/plasmid-associated DNA primase
MDLVADFIADRCVTDPAFREPFSSLYSAYVGWCKALGEALISQKAFALNLAAKGFEEHRTGTGRYRKGLKLVADGGKTSLPGVEPTKPASPNDGFMEA